MQNHAHKTAYLDLLGIIRLITIKENQKFPQVPVYSLLRDACLIIYEINKGLFENELPLLNDIKVIRHKVKLYTMGGNEKIYQAILDNAISKFGDDVDNFGLFIKNNQLVGSTVFQEYLFINTETRDKTVKGSQEKALHFAKYIGTVAGNLIKDFNERFSVNIPITTLKYVDDVEYDTRDIYHTEIFEKDILSNVFKTRILLITNEITFCLWFQKVIKVEENALTLDQYMYLRLASIKIDEIMDNIKNMRSHLTDDFNNMDAYVNNQLTTLLTDFQETLYEECKTLRNFVHYNTEEENFYDYLLTQIENDPSYVKEFIKQTNNTVLIPLQKILNEYFDISKMRSMGEFEKISNRLKTIFLGNKK